MLSIAVVTPRAGRKAAALLAQVEEPRRAAQAVVLRTTHTFSATRVAPFARPGVGVAIVTVRGEERGVASDGNVLMRRQITLLTF